MIRAFHSIRLAALALPVLLAGCVAAGDVRPYPPMAAIQPVVAAPAHASPGAIYQAGGASGLSLFADKRARDVGDLLTIPDGLHSLEAVEDSVILFTVVKAR